MTTSQHTKDIPESNCSVYFDRRSIMRPRSATLSPCRSAIGKVFLGVPPPEREREDSTEAAQPVKTRETESSWSSSGVYNQSNAPGRLARQPYAALSRSDKYSEPDLDWKRM